MDRGVIYPKDKPGEVWNGLVSIEETPSNQGKQTLYLDGVKSHQKNLAENFAGTIQAITYPESLYDISITNHRSNNFGLSYRTNRIDKYDIHLVYNVSLTSSPFTYEQNQNDLFSWNFTTKPVEVPGAKPSAHLMISASKAYLWTVAALEDLLYGNESGEAYLPSPEEVFEVFEANSILRIIDHGNGTFTAVGPDEVVYMLDDTTFVINWPSAVYINENSYKISSL